MSVVKHWLYLAELEQAADDKADEDAPLLANHDSEAPQSSRPRMYTVHRSRPPDSAADAGPSHRHAAPSSATPVRLCILVTHATSCISSSASPLGNLLFVCSITVPPSSSSSASQWRKPSSSGHQSSWDHVYSDPVSKASNELQSLLVNQRLQLPAIEVDLLHGDVCLMIPQKEHGTSTYWITRRSYLTWQPSGSSPGG